MTDFALDVDADGVATIAWDASGRSMNVMSMEGFADLDALVAQALGDPAVKGIVLTSRKKDFAAGMDLAVLAGLRAGGAAAIFDGTQRMHAVLRRIERAGMDPKSLKGAKPIVAALPGTALGIGYEIPLACHRILAADNPRAKIGLPEILVGLFPGAGGTTRLVRKMGLMAAAPFLLEGKTFDPARAKAQGLVDEVVAPEELLPRAKAWVLSAVGTDLAKPWDRKDYRMPGGAPYHPSGYMTFVGASAMVAGRTQGAFPAARALLSAAYEGALVPFDVALKVEARWFTSLLLDPSSSSMIRTLFLSKGELEKGARRPEGQPEGKVGRLGVLGAGMMGAGIAHVAASAGIDVVLIDATQEAAENGRAHSEGLLDRGMKRGSVTAEKKAETLSRIAPTTDYAALAGCDLVVEAVFEDVGVKAEATRRALAQMGEGAVFATNTSTLPITQLSEASDRPEAFVGLHFFSPVDRMALVEVIRGERTSDRAVAVALDLVRQLRKTPIVVEDARFFYANRCILPYLNEGVRLVAEGAAPALVENAARQLGMPLGPLQLIDETSIDLGVRIAKATRAALGDAYKDAAVDAVLFPMAEAGRMGRKAGAGFYAYDATGERAGLWDGLAAAHPLAATQPPVEEVKDRLLLIQVLEAVRALEEGVLADVREGDVGAVLGWGFAPATGGPFAWVDAVGAAEAVRRADALAAAHGERFAAPGGLRDMAATGRTFYPSAGAAAA